MMLPPILIVSGGAESVAAAVVEWAICAKKTVAVFALAEKSLLAGAVDPAALVYAPDGGYSEVLAALTEHVIAMRKRSAIPVLAFATDDDSLRLLIDASEGLGNDVLRCSRCQAVPGGGLDKAALFSRLIAAGLGDCIAETIVLRSEADVALAVSHFGSDVVIKPSSKPFRSVLANGAKVHVGPDLTRQTAILERGQDFHARRAWVAQRRLMPMHGGERSACVVRDAFGNVRYAEVVEWLKYPARGGSACIVETQPGSLLLREVTLRILDAVDAVGIIELSFLSDAEGKPRLLELNVRPWLQIELLQKSGFDLLSDAVTALEGAQLESEVIEIKSRSWISLERLALKLISGDGGPRGQTLSRTFRALSRRPTLSIWASEVRGIKWRWIKRLLRRARF